MKTDPYPYLVRYSPHVIKMRTKVLDTFDTDQKYFMKIIVGWNPS